jgi:hypothetical protein
MTYQKTQQTEHLATKPVHMKELVIESRRPAKKRKVPAASELQVPELPLDAPDLQTFLQQTQKDQTK